MGRNGAPASMHELTLRQASKHEAQFAILRILLWRCFSSTIVKPRSTGFPFQSCGVEGKVHVQLWWGGEILSMPAISHAAG